MPPSRLHGVGNPTWADIRSTVPVAIAGAVLISGCAQLQPAPAPPPAPVSAIPLEQPPAPKSFPSILFDIGQVDLTPEQRNQIREIADALKRPAVAEAAVLVTGHTDDRGSASSNEQVGLRRAEAVTSELVFNGILRERISVRSAGESQPVAPNAHEDGKDNPEGRAQNRRVEVIVQN